jgi:hypothetical protein
MAINDTDRRWLEVERVSNQVHKIVNNISMVGASAENKKNSVESLIAYLKQERLDDIWSEKDWTTIDQRITAGDAYWQS